MLCTIYLRQKNKRLRV